MKKNRFMICFFILLLGMSLCSGCGRKSLPDSGDKISIVCTTFPHYDWVKNLIAGNEEKYELTLVMNNGADLHNYQPTTDDMVMIGSCDIFIYVGGESDAWVEDALKQATNDDMKVINLMEVMGDSVREEEIVEGMDTGSHEEHDHGDEMEGTEYDEHIWLSLRNAQVMAAAIADVLAQTDSENKDLYEENMERYIEALDALDAEYSSMVQSAQRHTLLFGDRFPFRYMTDDYGLDYYAAFNGCSAETEASFETIAFLSGKLDELDIPVVLVIENSDRSVAQAVIDNSVSHNQKILTLDSLQSVTSKDIQAGVTYLSVMQSNLEVLREALN